MRKKSVWKVPQFASPSIVPDSQWINFELRTIQRRELAQETIFRYGISPVLRPDDVVVRLRVPL